MRLTILQSAALLTVSLATIPAPAEAAHRNVGFLSGVWEIEGSPEANPCGVGPFTNLVTITRDGKMINVDPNVGTGVGEAYRAGWRKFTAGFFGFINDNGTIIRYEVQGTIELVNRGELGGPFRAILYDPSGAPFCTYEGTITGTRLVAMPF